MALQTIDPSQAVITSVGSATSGGTSNSSKPVITGKADAGDIVKVYDGIKLLGSTTVAADGTWTFTVAADLKNGSHNFAAIANDAAGNFGASSAVVSVTVGTTVVAPSAPGITALTDNVGAITGPIKNGMTTDDTHPTLSGTGTAGNVINLYDGSTLIGSTTVGTDGTWKVAPTAALTNGTHDIYATQTNSAGASPHSADISFKVDTTTPATPTTPVITNDTTHQPITPATPTNDATPDISGTGTPGDTITVYDNDKPIGSLTIPDSGNWNFIPSPALPDGPNKIVVIETNPAGTPSTPSAPITVNVDTTVPPKPSLPIMTDESGHAIPSGTTTADAHPIISGTSTPGDTITVYDGANPIGTAIVQPNGTWSFTPTTDLSNGTHPITVTDTNPAGTSSVHSDPDSLVINAVVPAAPIIVSLIDAVGTITGPITNNMTTDDPKPTLHGTGVAGDVIKVYDSATLLGSLTVPAGGAWTFQPTTALLNGPHDFYATETNSKGTSGHSTDISFTVNTTTPATPAAPILTNDNGVVIPAGSTTADVHPHISGNGTAGDIIKVLDNGTQIGTAIVQPNGTWTFQPSPDLGNGTNVITVTETNPAGTSSPMSPPTSITVDPSIPAKPPVPVLSNDDGVSIPAGSSTMDGHPIISGTGKAGDIITVYDGATVIGSTQIDTTGNWTFKPATDLASGAHTISVTDTNAAGTTGPHSDAAAFTYAPTTVIISNLVDHTGQANVNIVNGGSTVDKAPTVVGLMSSALQQGETLVVFRDGQKIGTATVNGTTWSFQDSNVAVGSHTYTAQIQNSGAVGPMSSPLQFTEAALHAGAFSLSPPTASNMVTLLLDLSGLALGSGKLTTTVVSPSGTLLDTWVFTWNGAYWQSPLLGGYNDAGNNNNLTFTFKSAATGQSTVVGVANTTSWFTLENNSWNTLTGGKVVLTTQSVHAVQATDDQALIASTDDPQPVTHAVASAAAETAVTATDATHTTVNDHGAFIGTSGHDTIELNADPSVYFKESTAHIQGSTVHPTEPVGTAPAANTLHLTGDHQILDLTALTGKTAAAKISGIEVIDLGGHSNHLNLSLTDVLNLGEQDLFQHDGKQQLMVNGSNGDSVDLSNSHIAGVADGQWQAEGTAQVGGVVYNVYEHSSSNTELLVEHPVRIELH
jgi:hypothetical protein